MLCTLANAKSVYEVKSQLILLKNERDKLKLELNQVLDIMNEELKLQNLDLHMTVQNVTFEIDALQDRIDEIDARFERSLSTLQTTYGINFAGNIWDAALSFMNHLITNPPWYLRWALWWMFG
jgi:DNA phosphorothioation-dependent restriction protein DptG